MNERHAHDKKLNPQNTIFPSSLYSSYEKKNLRTNAGEKGMIVAAKTIALTAIELFNSPKIIELAKKELETKRGPDFKYEALLGDREPPLDYRK